MIATRWSWSDGDSQSWRQHLVREEPTRSIEELRELRRNIAARGVSSLAAATRLDARRAARWRDERTLDVLRELAAVLDSAYAEPLKAASRASPKATCLAGPRSISRPVQSWKTYELAGGSPRAPLNNA